MIKRVLYTVLYVTVLCKASFAFTVKSPAYQSPIFPEDETKKHNTPSSVDNINIELPDFCQLYERIRYVSPLAALVLDNKDGNFQSADKLYENKELKWKTIESNPRKTVQKIEKIDNFQNLSCPIVRFRATLNGPCVGKKFAEYIIRKEERAKWDPQIDDVINLYPAYDLNDGNIQTQFQFGEFQMLGIGYTVTKPYMMIDGREQLTLCGLQELPNKGALIWGVELEPCHDDMLPADKVRHTRARTHLFSVALAPTNDGKSFDVEYVLQLDAGGNLPSFLTTLVLIDTVKHMFDAAKNEFLDEEQMAPWVNEKTSISREDETVIAEQLGVLVPP